MGAMRALPLAVLVVLALSGPALAAAPDRGEVEQKDTFRDAATAPLEDLNLKTKGVPEALARARSDPYDIAGLDRCEAIAEEIGRLDGALGRDLDEAPPPDDRTRGQKLGGAVKDLGVAGVRTETQSVLPFRGWIRKLTGADAAQKKRDAAIQAGRIRRGYLKGVGMRMNCAPPAAPAWFVPAKARSEPLAGVGFSLQALWLKLVAWFWSWWPF
jgi:hypothetical protein